jgi:hypothetical protein
MHDGWLERTHARVPLPQKSTRIAKEKLCVFFAFFCGNGPGAADAAGQRGEEVKKILLPFS